MTLSQISNAPKRLHQAITWRFQQKANGHDMDIYVRCVCECLGHAAHSMVKKA